MQTCSKRILQTLVFGFFFLFLSKQPVNSLMRYTILDYFEANRLLAEHIKDSGAKSTQHIGKVTDRVDELVEVFTWETTDTDQIRLAFLRCAGRIQKQLEEIVAKGLYPDPYNGTANKFQLVEDIVEAFRFALTTTGKEIPEINIKTISEAWQYEGLLAYLKDMQRQLKFSTFDNLLEALRYFEKSSAMIGLFFKILDEKGIIK